MRGGLSLRSRLLDRRDSGLGLEQGEYVVVSGKETAEDHTVHLFYMQGSEDSSACPGFRPSKSFATMECRRLSAMQGSMAALG